MSEYDFLGKGERVPSDEFIGDDHDCGPNGHFTQIIVRKDGKNIIFTENLTGGDRVIPEREIARVEEKIKPKTS
ncbi:MAG TPA: hypothetical protein VG895_01415 [Patescibacteria group bacterium]|nr:hypothetical protein [Patescibacteria group bacterium]